MKKTLVLALAMGFVMVLGGVAMAADTNTLTVQASVTGTCKFSTGASTLNFGALDPSLATNPSATTTTQFWCTKGVSTDVIAAGNGLNFAGGKRQMKDAVSTDVIPYTLTLTKDGNSNTGPAAPRILTIDGSILNSDYTGKSAGSYSDTVVLSITP